MATNSNSAQVNPGPNIMECDPQKDGCVKLAYAQKYEYVLQLAADLAGLEKKQDDEGFGELWQNYGNRDCIAACHVIERHPELMPEPR